MPTLLFTGFPGFLGSELLPRILARSPGEEAACLVQPKYVTVARERAEALAAADPALRGRIRLVEGDITRQGLGLGATDALLRDVVEIFHLAALYDLSAAREPSMRVNVEGTRNVLDVASSCPGLRRFHHMSTCFVSGRHPGLFTEDDLDRGQSFGNFYEETKFLAEVAVRNAMNGGLPATVYRPSIVVGDSGTGATQKYDGPYYIIRWILRQPRLAFMPVVGDPGATHVNVVPSDFVVSGVAHLAALAGSAGKVYQLADPQPLTVSEMLDVIARETRRQLVRIRVSRRVAKAAIEHVPGVYRLMQIPSSVVDYMMHPTEYATRNTQEDLAGSGIGVPPFASYAGNLVEFVRRHPHIGSAAMA